MRLWTFRILLLLPVALLFAAAIPRLQTGLAIDAAYPVPVFVTANTILPKDSYKVAAQVLAGANPRDGQTLIQRAEIGSLMGIPSEEVTTMLRDGLSYSPSSVRGWALLAEQLEDRNPKAASQALANSLLLGPYDYFAAGRRANAAAVLWDQLSDDARDAALRQARLLWSTASLNHLIEPLLATEGGPELLAHAFQDRPDELRALNRWVAAERRAAAASQ